MKLAAAKAFICARNLAYSPSQIRTLEIGMRTTWSRSSRGTRKSGVAHPFIRKTRKLGDKLLRSAYLRLSAFVLKYLPVTLAPAHI
jgi:hypothetical protein